MRSPSFWYTPSALRPRLLWPLGWLYGTVAELHGRWRMTRAHTAGVPVISVGNLTMGGSGKTPVVAMLAEYFPNQSYKVAVVSRGYGGHARTPTLVNSAIHTATDVGDEPLMLARRFANIQVWIGRNRPAAVRAAEAAGATLIILDDGFQRRDVARTVDILVIGPQGLGNGLPFPAGPLREFPTALHRADIILALNNSGTFGPAPTYHLAHDIHPGALTNLGDKPLVAFAGLGHPQKFFTALKRARLNVMESHPYPDHHVYTERDRNFLSERAKHTNATLVCTVKDATKLPAGFATAVADTLAGNNKSQLLAALGSLIKKAPKGR